jgi:hypothetical protein
LFDDQGELTELTSRQAEIEAIVTLMDTLDGAQLHQALVSFASGLQGYWGYYQGAQQVYQECITRYPREVVQALACGWQLERQATNNKAYGMRKRLAQDTKFYFSYAATLLPQQFPLSVSSSLTFIATERSFGRLAIHCALRQVCPPLHRAR